MSQVLEVAVNGPRHTPRTRSIITIAIVGAVAIAGSLMGVVWLHGSVANRAPPTVIVAGVSWTIDYAGTSIGYFGSNPLNGCLPCSEPGNPGGWYSLALFVVNNGSTNHTIESANVDPPFISEGVSPALPWIVAPGATAYVSVIVEYPIAPGSYAISGTVTTK